MSSISSSSISTITSETDDASGLEKDFKAWLTSLQSGNLSAEKKAFATLKKDFRTRSKVKRIELQVKQ